MQRKKIGRTEDAFDLRLPLDEQALPQYEMVMVHCSLHWILFILLPMSFFS